MASFPVVVVYLAASAVGLTLTFGCGEAAAPTTTQEGATSPTTATLRTLPPGVERSMGQTTSYRIELWTGRNLAMMAAFPVMSMRDQGHPVNHHLEIHIFDTSNGAPLPDVTPTVKITDRATGASRELATDQETGASLGTAYVTACTISGHRLEDIHFGDNVYLPDGNYEVTVGVGNESATIGIALF